ncbi:MAG: hypothetical protein HQL31_00480 [Planctomycetes bacterium]|nr:hypothetical protein [Planctomycetota bacterium]
MNTGNQGGAKDVFGHDRILESLERGEIWFSAYKWHFVVAIAVAFLVALFFHNQESRRREFERDLWGKRSSLTDIESRREFLNKYPLAQASVSLYLQLAKEELDSKHFDKALDETRRFIEFYPDHAFSGTAHLLRAYAHEELDEVKSALSAYRLAGEKDVTLLPIAESASKRLAGAGI